MPHPVQFNPDGQRLWINVEMFGMYVVFYNYQLWSADASTPPVLTNPIKSGSNEVPHDDFYPVVNDYAPSEPVAKNSNRIIDVRFKVLKVEDDNGYRMKVTVLQGDSFSSAQEIGFHEAEGNNGGAAEKEVFVTIKLIN